MNIMQDGKRMKKIGIIILVVSAIFFIIGQSRMSAADKELRAYYGGGFMGDAAYRYDRAGYYLPGEQMRDFSIYGIVIGGIMFISGIVTERKKAPRDLLSDIGKNADSERNEWRNGH